MHNIPQPPPPPPPPPWHGHQYGEPQQPRRQVVYVQSEPGRALGIAGFVCGLIGAVVGMVPLLSIIAFPLGVIAVVFGIVAFSRRSKARLGRGMAVSSMVLGAIAVMFASIGFYIIQDGINDIDREFDELDQELNG